MRLTRQLDSNTCIFISETKQQNVLHNILAGTLIVSCLLIIHAYNGKFYRDNIQSVINIDKVLCNILRIQSFRVESSFELIFADFIKFLPLTLYSRKKNIIKISRI